MCLKKARRRYTFLWKGCHVPDSTFIRPKCISILHSQTYCQTDVETEVQWWDYAEPQGHTVEMIQHVMHFQSPQPKQCTDAEVEGDLPNLSPTQIQR